MHISKAHEQWMILLKWRIIMAIQIFDFFCWAKLKGGPPFLLASVTILVTILTVFRSQIIPRMHFFFTIIQIYSFFFHILISADLHLIEAPHQSSLDNRHQGPLPPGNMGLQRHFLLCYILCVMICATFLHDAYVYMYIMSGYFRGHLLWLWPRPGSDCVLPPTGA